MARAQDKLGAGHLLSMADLTPQEIQHLLARAGELKERKESRILEGKVLALVFEKPSLRTRVSFDVAMHQLGGRAIYLSQAEVGLGQREPIADVARVLGRYVDGIVVRTFSQDSAQELARHGGVPVINGLTDEEHPCQALSDFLTILEKKGRLSGVSLAFVGDGNNVAHSLMLGAALLGMDFRMAGPPGYGPEEGILSRALALAAQNGARIEPMEELQRAVAGADVVYTDVWTSMGQEAEAAKRRQDFSGYQVDLELLGLAGRDAIFMHPLPAHPGEEIAPGLLDSLPSVVFDQAENRLHLQKALLAELLGGR
ncbi:MAG: ornithine carbamoyltransferase [Dehalococcoidia bacterium]